MFLLAALLAALFGSKKKRPHPMPAHVAARGRRGHRRSVDGLRGTPEQHHERIPLHVSETREALRSVQDFASTGQCDRAVGQLIRASYHRGMLEADREWNPEDAAMDLNILDEEFEKRLRNFHATCASAAEQRQVHRQVRQSGQPHPAPRRAAYAADKASGMTLTQIANKHGVRVSTVRDVLFGRPSRKGEVPPAAAAV